MATGTQNTPAVGPVPVGAARRVRHVLVLPAVVGALAVAVAASVGHLAIGLLVAAGAALGAANGLLLEQATARLTPDSSITRKVIVTTSLGRLGLITALALVLAFVFRPNGWVLLLSLAGYQLLVLLATISAAAREARLG